MNKRSLPIPNGIHDSEAGNTENPPLGIDAAPSPPEYLTPYSAAAKAIFIKANGHLAYKRTRRVD